MRALPTDWLRDRLSGWLDSRTEKQDISTVLSRFQIPAIPDPEALDLLLVRLDVVAELRREPETVIEGDDLLHAIQAEIEAALTSPLKNHEWPERRERIVQYVHDLERVLYFTPLESHANSDDDY